MVNILSLPTHPTPPIQMSQKSPAPLPFEWISKSAEDFARLGMRPGNQPESWEDGIRTDPTAKNYEWWYFDAHLDDGSTLVVAFFPKPMAPMRTGLAPMINIEFDRPDGTSYKRDITFDANAFSAAKDKCDVRIGQNYFRWHRAPHVRRLVGAGAARQGVSTHSAQWQGGVVGRILLPRPQLGQRQHAGGA